MSTSIEWCDETWNPIIARVRPDAAAIAAAKGYTSLVQIAEKQAGKRGHHCEHAHAGCANCYAEAMNGRDAGGAAVKMGYIVYQGDKPLIWSKRNRCLWIASRHPRSGGVTVFATKESALAAIRASGEYQKRHGYDWDHLGKYWLLRARIGVPR